MNCTVATDLFSDFLEGELSPEQRSALESHFESCAACHSSFESFQYALGDLQSLSLRETSRSEVGAIMAAVDRSAQVPSRPTRTALTHLVAASVGALLVWIFWPQDIRIEERIVENRVEVPVEVRVEVPVDRIVQVEVPVEVRVEVPVEVERVTRVASPLQVHANCFMAFGAALVELADLAHEAEEARRAEMPVAQVTSREPAEKSLRIAERSRRRAPARLVRSGDQLTLKTYGSTDEVVPVLIAMLRDGDARTRQVVEARLESYRSELGGELPPTSQRESSREPFGLATLKSLVGGPSVEDEAPNEHTTAESWRAWWNSCGDEIASAAY